MITSTTAPKVAEALGEGAADPMTDGRSGILKPEAERLEGRKRRRTASAEASKGRNQKRKGLERIKGQRIGS